MEVFVGIVHRITYQNLENGWTVLKVNPIRELQEVKTVIVYQTNIFAGATLRFEGEWIEHPKFGEQFKAEEVTEQKPATASALEKYLGSGLIKGVGPKTAKRIVKHFGADTLDVFENEIDRLTEVSGIAKTKLQQIENSWTEHREIRNVMLFLQEYGISTLFAVKIFKTYGNDAIKIVKDNPYQLAKDIYGIGFFSADKVALNMNLDLDSPKRIRAAISHVLAASKEAGHCYLEIELIKAEVEKLLKQNFDALVEQEIVGMEEENELKTRQKEEVKCYYSKSLFYDELFTQKRVKTLLEQSYPHDTNRVANWLERFNQQQKYPLSEEQYDAVSNIVGQAFSILTGGPGCGKTTTTKALVRLLTAMGKKILLAAPTGRAAQRMAEVIGRPAQTIHRLLVWQPAIGGFQKNEEYPLECDFLIVDETSMLDISLASALLKAVADSTQVLFIGDADQLPSVGAGNVLKDLIESEKVPIYRLIKVFRQAQESLIIQYAHQINNSTTPKIDSPIHQPNLWGSSSDCLFLDAEEATKEQSRFIHKIRETMRSTIESQENVFIKESDTSYKTVGLEDDFYVEHTSKEEIEAMKKQGVRSYIFSVPDKFLKTNITTLLQSPNEAKALQQVLKKVHPWSSLHYGFTASQMVVRLYTQTIAQKLGKHLEVQILTPMKVGSMGANNLNQLIQQAIYEQKKQALFLEIGNRIFRMGDRVIQRKNNYDLDVFNGDIGYVSAIYPSEMVLEVTYVNGNEKRAVQYKKNDLGDLGLAYSITIHKSQGSEFDVVIIPIVLQHFNMLYQNLIYTALTRAKKMAIFVGSRKALHIAVHNVENHKRKTMLKELLQGVI